MSNTLQYLDHNGLKHYDEKIKDYIGDRTCSIGEDGYWYIGDKKTEYKAAGKDGVDGAPGQDGQDGKDGVDGRDGTSVTITGNSKVDGVTKVTFSDGNIIEINDGEDADGTDLQLGEEIKTNVACGALGTGITIPANSTLADIVKLLTTTVYRPSKGSNPSATLTMKNKSGDNYASVVEIGTTISPILTPGFIDGTFNTYDKGATASKSMNAGCVATDYRIYRNSKVGTKTTPTQIFDYSDPEGKKPSFGEEFTYTDSHKIGDEVISYTTKIEYNASTNSPLDSDGAADTTVKYDAGSIENNTAATATTSTITGKYQYYVGKGDVDPTADDIRAEFDKTTKKWVNGAKVTIKNQTHTKTIFAIPSSYTLTKAFSVNTNDDVTKQFIPKNITIKDAGGNDVSYTMYVQTNGEPGNLLIEFTYE